MRIHGSLVTSPPARPLSTLSDWSYPRRPYSGMFCSLSDPVNSSARWRRHRRSAPQRQTRQAAASAPHQHRRSRSGKCRSAVRPTSWSSRHGRIMPLRHNGACSWRAERLSPRALGRRRSTPTATSGPPPKSSPGWLRANSCGAFWRSHRRPSLLSDTAQIETCHPFEDDVEWCLKRPRGDACRVREPEFPRTFCGLYMALEDRNNH